MLWAQKDCRLVKLRCSATSTMSKVTLVWMVLASRPLLSCISEMKHKCMLGLLALESYHTCYDINYVPKSLVCLDNVLVFYLVGLVHQSSDVTICCFGIAGSWISLWYTLWKHVKELMQTRHPDVLMRGNRVQYLTRNTSCMLARIVADDSQDLSRVFATLRASYYRENINNNKNG